MGDIDPVRGSGSDGTGFSDRFGDAFACGDMVMAFDPSIEQGIEPVARRRAASHQPIAAPMAPIAGAFAATAGHPFLIGDGPQAGGFMALGEVIESDLSVGAADGALATLEASLDAGGPHTVYNLTVEDLHTYVAGGYRVHNTSLFLPQTITGVIGAAIGAQLASLFADDDIALGLVAGAAGSSIGGYIGDAIEGTIEPAYVLGTRFGYNIAIAATGYFGSRAGAELADSLGLPPFGAGLVSSYAASVATYAASYVIENIALSLGVGDIVKTGADEITRGTLSGAIYQNGTGQFGTGFNPLAAVGSFAGSFLAQSILGDDIRPQGAQIGSAVGSLAASIAVSSPGLGFLAGANFANASLLAAGPAGWVAAAVITFVAVFAGTLFGGLFGRKPRPWAITDVEFGRRNEDEAFYRGLTNSGDGGNTSLTIGLADNAVDALNSILGAVGGTVVTVGAGAYSYGHRKSKVYTQPATGRRDRVYFKDAQDALNVGIQGTLNLTEIEGGDIYQKRALALLTGPNSTDVPETTEELRQDLGAASVYGVRLDNPYLTDAVLSNSGFAAGARYEDSLARAEELGVAGAFGSFASDTYRRTDSDGAYETTVLRRQERVEADFSSGPPGDPLVFNGYEISYETSELAAKYYADETRDVLEIDRGITRGTITVWRNGLNLYIKAAGDANRGGELELVIANWNLERDGVYWEQFDAIRFADGTEFDLSSIVEGSGWSGGSTTLTAVNAELSSAVQTALGVTADSDALADADLTARLAAATPEGEQVGQAVDVNAFHEQGATDGWDLFEIAYQRRDGTAGADTLDAAAGYELLKGGAGDDTYQIDRGDGVNIIQDLALAFSTSGFSEATWYEEGVSTSSGGGEEPLVETHEVYRRDVTGFGRQIVSLDQLNAGADDKIEFASGIAPADILLGMSGADLIIGIKDPAQPDQTLAELDDQIIVKDWSDANQRIEQLVFADGAVWTAEDVASQFIQQNGVGAVMAFDLTGDGLELTPAEQNGVYFDIDQDGFLERLGWVGPQDGLLVLDRNEDGVINDAGELFSAWSGAYGGSLPTLASLDTNSDGVIDALDTDFEDLRIWVDQDQDGQTGVGEINALHRFGILSISLAGETNLSGVDSALYGAAQAGGSILRRAELDQLGLVGGGAGAGYGVVLTVNEGGVSYDASGLTLETGEDITVLEVPEGGGGAVRADLAAGAYIGTYENDQLTSIALTGESSFISAGDGDDTLTGGAGDDILVGGGGSDVMSGGAGDDTIVADDADDLANVSGGAGTDLLIYEGEEALGTDGAPFDIASRGFERIIAGAGDDVLSTTIAGDVEMSGGLGDDTITGGSGANMISGEDGHDTLEGGAGDDEVFGGAGDDRIIAGAGADQIDGGSGVDTLDFSGSTAGVMVDLTAGVGAGGDAQGDSYLSIESVIGTSAADTITGGDGAERFDGGAGADTIDGGDGVDTVSYENSTTAVDIDLTRATQLGGDAQGDALSNVENLVGSAQGDTLVGSADANRLEGGAGADTLTGGDGDDILIGGAGDDVMSGGIGDDAYLIGADTGADTIDDGGASALPQGANRIVFDAGIGVHDLKMTQDGQDLLVEVLGPGASTTRVKRYFDAPAAFTFELADGGEVAPQVVDRTSHTGTSSNNIIAVTTAGTVSAGYGDDIVFGSDGDDTLEGDPGDDLQATYDDVLVGGAGNDILLGRGGDDVYVYNRGDGHDTIRDELREVDQGTPEDPTVVYNSDGGASDTLWLGQGIDVDEVALERSGDDLVVHVLPDVDRSAPNTFDADTTLAIGSVRIENQFSDPLDTIETIAFASGEEWRLQRTLDDGSIVDEIAAHLGTEKAESFDESGSNDPVYRNGFGGDDTILSGAGHDTLVGGAGDDTLDSGAGDDTLAGGEGDNTLRGGAGNDRYIVSQTPDAAPAASHTITDTDGFDEIVFAEGIQPEHLMLIASGSDLLIGVLRDESRVWENRRETIRIVNGLHATEETRRQNAIEGFTFADGVTLTLSQLMRQFGDPRSATPDQLIWFDAAITGADLGAGDDSADLGQGDDIVSGGDGDDTLRGNEGYDELDGDAGDDSLYGGQARDKLTGGVGNDRLEGGAGSDLYYFDTGFGRDALNDEAWTVEIVRQVETHTYTRQFGDGDPRTYTRDIQTDLPVDVELDAGEKDVISFGAVISVADVYAEYDASLANGTLFIGVRGPGEATVAVRDLANRIAIENWSDEKNRIEYLKFDDGTTFDLRDLDLGQPTRPIAEFARDVSAPVSLTGDAAANELQGDDTANTMSGGDGDDTLRGWGGDDQLEGGLGADVIDGGAGVDTARYDNAASGVTVDLGAGLGSQGEADGDTLISVENLLGSSHADTLVGSADANRIDGGDGDDLIDGASGDDLLLGGAGADTLLGGAGVDRLEGGDDADSLDGDTGDDTLIGGNGADSLDGGAGDDTLIGGDGADSLAGGAGDDTLIGGDGDDSYRIGAATGSDLIDDLDGATPTGANKIVFEEGISTHDLKFSQNGQDLLIYVLGSGGSTVRVKGYFDAPTAFSFEFADGSSFAPQVATLVSQTGTDAAEVMTFDTAGVFEGYDGADTIYGSTGADTIRGDRDQSVDSIFDDVLIGGEGDDLLYGYGGDDTYVYHRGDGNDTIRDDWTYDVVTETTETYYVWVGGGEDQHLEERTRIVTTTTTETGDGGVNDVLWLGHGIEVDEVVLEKSGDDLLVRILTDETGEATVGSILVDDHFAEDRLRLETIRFSSGENWSLPAVAFLGTSAADTFDIVSSQDLGIHGGAGSDYLRGDDGNDLLIGGEGSDSLLGEAGEDRIYGNAGNDVIFGGSSSDILDGGAGNDRLYSHWDPVRTELSANTLDGGAGDDELYGAAGVDTMLGGTGADRLEGEGGADLLHGGAGNDQYVFESGDGADTIDDRGDATDLDRLVYSDLSDAGALTLSLVNNGQDLLVARGADQVTIERYFSSDGSGQVEEVQLSSEVHSLVTAATVLMNHAAGFGSQPATLSNLLSYAEDNNIDPAVIGSPS